jgi:glutamate--cysteine ligase
LQEHPNKSYYLPHATCLRMGDLGYQSKAQEDLVVNYNDLDSYITSLLEGLTRSHPDYEKIGVCVDGQYRQLNSNILQIENEFYSTIRPKRVGNSGETPIKALQERGVEYIEVRSIDINLFDSRGIDKQHACFLEVFLLYCLLSESEPSCDNEYQRIADNQHRVVNFGRDPQLEIWCHGQSRNLRQCGSHLLDKLLPLADLLDSANGCTDYSSAVKQQYEKLQDPDLTPSGKILREMEQQGLAFFQLAKKYSQQHCDDYLAASLPDKEVDYFSDQVTQSLAAQQQIEENDSGTFENHLERYFDQYREAQKKLSA